ncbi:MAG: DUF2589 domain-containing protein [Cytophagales bacterium]|uniref:DUF2589 domain-containing protein n=1 Tax=Algoriphagus taiwanensis TaxID=1445656 RepID=A0ABQ6Q5J8_9BACT|nr:MAG: DUF2589 domain-containing protein [Cytophagales bacterium]GMQ34905.1 hypothetical protein Ataiwa_31780 [Algoriphagus taiwanensis]
MSYVNRTLRSLPFGRIIGGPMVAAIQSQGLAAKSTVNFIKEVGFKSAPEEQNGDQDETLGDVRNVTFRYTRKTAGGSSGGNDAGEETVALTVPILTIVPIPFIRIQEMTIQFTANITEQQEYKSGSASSGSVATDTTMSFKAGGFFSPVKFNLNAKVSTRNNWSSHQSNKVNTSTQYTMDIQVKAVQDEMPAGLAKVLDIMEQAILEKPAAGGGGGG